MAGGRRPASYASGARHHTSLERTVVSSPDGNTTPPLSSTTGPSLPPWIPSIWQPPPPRDPEPPLTKTRNLPNPSDSSFALANALDAAVQSAVLRALGNSALSTVPHSPHLHTSSISSDMGIDEDTSSSTQSAKERELTELVDTLQHRLAEREHDLLQLSNKLASLELALTAGTEAIHRRTDNLELRVAAHHAEIADTLTDIDHRVAVRVTPVHDQVKANQSAISKLRSSQKARDADTRSATDSTHDLSQRMTSLENSLQTQVERQGIKLEQLERSLSAALQKLAERDEREEQNGLKKEVDELRKSSVSSAEGVAHMRSKVKRVESQMTEVAKKATESMELSHAFEQALQSKFNEVQSTVGTMQKIIMEVYPAHELIDWKRNNDGLASKLETLEGNVQSLKKLIESNLRTQWSAESIVKEQVSLITKHVCVAMRQYTARRISENNTLIDRALRARVPEYAKNEEQFVLVREEDGEGNESIDIQRTTDASTFSES